MKSNKKEDVFMYYFACAVSTLWQDESYETDFPAVLCSDAERIALEQTKRHMKRFRKK